MPAPDLFGHRDRDGLRQTGSLLARKARLSERVLSDLFATSAVAIAEGAGFVQWSSFRTGDYTQFLRRCQCKPKPAPCEGGQMSVGVAEVHAALDLRAERHDVVRAEVGHAVFGEALFAKDLLGHAIPLNHVFVVPLVDDCRS